MRKTTIGFAVLVAFAVGSSLTFAAPVASQRIPGQTDWVVHVDLEQFRATELGERVRERLDQNPKAAAARAFAQVGFGIDLDADLLDVTLFGQGDDPNDAAMLINVNASLDRVIEAARKDKNADLQESQYGEHTIYSAMDRKKNQRRYIAVVPTGETGNVVIISAAIQTVQGSLDVLDGQVGNAADGELDQLLSADAGAHFLMAALDLASLLENKPRSAMFQNVRQFSVQSGEAEGQSFLTLAVTAVDQATANTMNQALTGLMALGRLRAQEKPQIQQLLDAVSIDQQAATLQIDVRMAAETFVDMLQQHAERHGR